MLDEDCREKNERGGIGVRKCERALLCQWQLKLVGLGNSLSWSGMLRNLEYWGILPRILGRISEC
jgi:hypothetical protein